MRIAKELGSGFVSSPFTRDIQPQRQYYCSICVVYLLGSIPVFLKKYIFLINPKVLVRLPFSLPVFLTLNFINLSHSPFILSLLDTGILALNHPSRINP